MGGSSSSSRTTNTTNIDENTLQMADNSVGDGARVNLGIGEGAEFNGEIKLSDQGAIKAGEALGLGALDLAGVAVDDAGDLAAKAFDTATAQNKLFADELTDSARLYSQQTEGHIDRALSMVAESTRSETAEAFNRLLKYGVAALAIVAVIYFFSRRKS